MPLVTKEIEPCLNLTNSGILLFDSPTDVLQSVNVANAIGSLQQLGLLADYAIASLGDILNSTNHLNDRINNISARTTRLVSKLSNVDKKINSSEFQMLTGNIASRISDQKPDTRQLLKDSMPNELRVRYLGSEVSMPPALEQMDVLIPLDELTKMGGSCSKLYSDPEFFLAEWIREKNEEETKLFESKLNRKKERRERRQQRVMAKSESNTDVKKELNWRNRYGTDVFDNPMHNNSRSPMQLLSESPKVAVRLSLRHSAPRTEETIVVNTVEDQKEEVMEENKVDVTSSIQKAGQSTEVLAVDMIPPPPPPDRRPLPPPVAVPPPPLPPRIKSPPADPQQPSRPPPPPPPMKSAIRPSAPLRKPPPPPPSKEDFSSKAVPPRPPPKPPVRFGQSADANEIVAAPRPPPPRPPPPAAPPPAKPPVQAAPPPPPPPSAPGPRVRPPPPAPPAAPPAVPASKDQSTSDAAPMLKSATTKGGETESDLVLMRARALSRKNTSNILEAIKLGATLKKVGDGEVVGERGHKRVNSNVKLEKIGAFSGQAVQNILERRKVLQGEESSSDSDENEDEWL